MTPDYAVEVYHMNLSQSLAQKIMQAIQYRQPTKHMWPLRPPSFQANRQKVANTCHLLNRIFVALLKIPRQILNYPGFAFCHITIPSTLQFVSNNASRQMTIWGPFTTRRTHTSALLILSATDNYVVVSSFLCLAWASSKGFFKGYLRQAQHMAN